MDEEALFELAESLGVEPDEPFDWHVQIGGQPFRDVSDRSLRDVVEAIGASFVLASVIHVGRGGTVPDPIPTVTIRLLRPIESVEVVVVVGS